MEKSKLLRKATLTLTAGAYCAGLAFESQLLMILGHVVFMAALLGLTRDKLSEPVPGGERFAWGCAGFVFLFLVIMVAMDSSGIFRKIGESTAYQAWASGWSFLMENREWYSLAAWLLFVLLIWWPWSKGRDRET